MTLRLREPTGFQENHSAIDHIFTISQIIKKANAYNMNIPILFIDFEKAFDSVDLSYLWKAFKIGNTAKIQRSFKK